MILKSPNYLEKINNLKNTIDCGQLSPCDQKKAQSFIAGLKLEKEMAYFLDIKFKDCDYILVLNDLKVEYEGKTAQVDHLVLTCYSAYFIESKSVAGNLSVNEYGEWTRWYGKNPVNMDSPLEQSKRHEDILLGLLASHVSEFLGKVIGFQKRLGSYTCHHYIAVSSKTHLSGKGREQLKGNLKKADQIAETILGYHKDHAKGHLGWIADDKDDDKFKTLTNKELKAMGDFLLANDISEDYLLKALNIQIPAKDPGPETSSEYELEIFQGKCPECSNQMNILWGQRYKSYYWKCPSCNKNKSITDKCPNCKKKLWVKKDKKTYHIHCPDCEVSGLLYQEK